METESTDLSAEEKRPAFKAVGNRSSRSFVIIRSTSTFWTRRFMDIRVFNDRKEKYFLIKEM